MVQSEATGFINIYGLPTKVQAIVNSEKEGVLPEFLAYAMPLIQAELTPIYVEGLPHHIYLPET